MLVIVVQTSGISGQHVPWTGRRHDDDGLESTGAASADGLFEAVFAALHDGEQVAIGFDCPLTVPGDGVDATAPAAQGTLSVEGGPGIEQMRRLVVELGKWRPWTIVTTSLPRWRATTSVLLWEAVSTDDVDPPSAIDAFYDLVRDGDPLGVEDTQPSLVNLAAGAALESEVTADPAEATRPVLRVDVSARSVAAS